MRSNGNMLQTITTEIKTPTEALKALRDPRRTWLTDLREMRARVLYSEGGHNPIFLSQSGAYCDVDPFDAYAHHILFRAGQCIVACARVSVLCPDAPGYLASMLGHKRLEEILSDMGISWDRTCEASRWIVAWKFRNLGLGPRVVAAAWALAQSMNMQSAFVMAGTRQCQDDLLCRMGARPVLGIPLIPAMIIDDELRLLHFNMRVPVHRTLKRISARTSLLSPVSINSGLVPSEVTIHAQHN